ncbi:HD domain-containing phosphohydrolase [Mangrovibacter yixingensis]|uniref:HD domain-containing phosphohydrolase n=1 Tax=Mangrovibacter yixingensis TaxID=1529639 RepID=UPI001CF9E601|nr:HD domain-containing phosphohydrolase [Mangrovibacter yixingensis]
MLEKLRHAKFSMKLTVVTIFVALSLLIIAVALAMQFYFAQSFAKDAARTLFTHTALNVSDKIRSLDSETSGLTTLFAQFPGLDKQDVSQPIRPITPAMAQAIRQHPHVYAIYIGYGNGDFYELINLDSSKNLRNVLGATAKDRWLIVNIRNTPAGRQQDSSFFDDTFTLTHQKQSSSQYAANSRPWYLNAMASDTTIKTEPYVFHTTQSSGVTFARRIGNSQNVLAVDISLDTLSVFLQNNRLFKHSETFIFDSDGNVSAQSLRVRTNHNTEPVSPIPLTPEETQAVANMGTLRVANELDWAPYDFSWSGIPQGYAIDLMNMLAGKTGLKLEYVNGFDWNTLTGMFRQGKLDVIPAIFPTPQRTEWGLFTQAWHTAPPALITRVNTRQLNTLSRLQGRTLAVPKGWSLAEDVTAHFPKINLMAVADSLAALHAVANGEADAALETRDVARYLTGLYNIPGLKVHNPVPLFSGNNSAALSMLVTADKPLLRDVLNKAIQSLTPDEKSALAKRWLTDSPSSAMQRTLVAGIVPSPAFVQLAEQAKNTQTAVSGEVVIDGMRYTLFVQPVISTASHNHYLGIMVPTKVLLGPYMKKVYLSLAITLLCLALLAPAILYLASMIVTPVRLLSLENKKIRQRQFRDVHPVPSRINELHHLSDSIYNMALSLEAYQASQRALMDSFIQLIANAIDQKSPYTGGHCTRVPVIAMMLAESADKSQLPAFQQFHFENEDQWREFRIAAWLHDCGKVTSPEHIIDKGSKLETIFNRIHEIRTRFEVLWRDADILYWQGKAAGEPEEALQATRQARQQQLTDEFAFIAQSNIGSEFMSEDKITRIREIGAQTWTRHFSDREGLSPEEAKRLSSIAEKPLPAEEKLLDDKPEHLFPWIKDPAILLSNDMKMTAPSMQANLGEIHNLSIQKGTLTESDRYRINEHIIATIRMLESLPFPKELARIPEIAGGHHETLKGTGYPKKLTAENLSLEARILAIADIFEALTAGDRPYKKAKTLSEAIKILHLMVKDQHLDKDLFELLLTSGIYQRYAEQYLEPGQLDEVDIQHYLKA